MLVDTLPARLAFWLGRPVRLDAIPAEAGQQVLQRRTSGFAANHLKPSEDPMLVDTLPSRVAFWLGRPARLDPVPAPREQDPIPSPRDGAGIALRPALDVETRLMLRDLGWPLGG